MNSTLKTFYERLFERYGDTGWWPGDTRDEVIIGAVLTQNTSWTNVEMALQKLREAGILSLQRIGETERQPLSGLIRSSGFYNQKSERLILLSREIISRYGDVSGMLRRDLQELTNFLKPLKGVGQETLDSILLYALDKPVFVVDKYTMRIFSRAGINESNNISEIKNLVSQVFGQDLEKLKNLHGMIVFLAKDHCKSKPVCSNCPLLEICSYREKNL